MLGLAFVMSKRQNHFFVELVEALRYELERIGVPSFVTTNGFPRFREGLVYVLFPPHEYFMLEGRLPDRQVLARTIFICAEQPDTAHFDQNAELAPAAGAVFDINARAVREFLKRGIESHELPLGYSEYWRREDERDERDVDITFMGSLSLRRALYLASYADVLSRHSTRLLISDNSTANHAATANFLVDDVKLRLLRRSKVLINLHQSTVPYFEWTRVMECVHSRCVVISEHSTDFHPFEPGAHFISGKPESLALLAEDLVENEALRRSIQEDALTCLMQRRPLRTSVVELVEVALTLARGHATARRRWWRAPEWATRPVSPVDLEEAAAPGLSDGSPPASELSVVRQALKEVRLELLDVRRELRRARLITETGAPDAAIREVWQSTGYRGHRPRVSIVTALYNHAALIPQALQSAMDSLYTDIECVIVDDGSTDGSGDAVVDWSTENPALPLLLLRHPVNRGLAAARNTALDFARGELVFILDADNKLFPSGLGKLVSALEDDTVASFSYGIISCYGGEGHQGLLSQFPWLPLRLRQGNYIDAMALFRAEALRAAGGYTGDRRLYGWEDYDLYCRMAERGESAAFVPEIVASYRVSPTSMLSLTNVSMRAAFAALREHCPNLMQGIVLPS
jgi:GT2 family glycosyltransferase